MTAPGNDDAPAGGTARGVREEQSVRAKHSAKSTASEAQRERIISALRAGPKTSYDLRSMGCYQCPARIIELRRAGYNIVTERVTLYDAEGYAHPNAARYHLQGEPADGERPQ